MANFKHASDLSQKLALLKTVLEQADLCPNKNNAFFSNLTEISETLDQMRYQVDKYLRTNAVKRKFMESDVRNKLKGLQFALSFQIRLIDTIYVGQVLNRNGTERNLSDIGHLTNSTSGDLRGVPVDKELEAIVRNKISEFDKQLEELKRKNEMVEELRS